MTKILIVDDEKDLAFLLGEILENKGYQVTVAKTAKKAIEMIEKERFDLYLLDIILPDINGVELFLKIKGLFPESKAIMMTGFAVEDLIESAIKHGAYACIYKPFDLQKLFAMIEECLKSKKKVVLIVDSIAMIREEIALFLKEKGYSVYEAENGGDATRKIKENHYEIILLDYHLPDMNGIEVFKEIKDINSNAVFILMLAKGFEGEIGKAALDAGFCSYITKPVDLNGLLKIIKEVA